MTFSLFRAMSSAANKEQFLKQFEQIVEGVKQNKNKVSFTTRGSSKETAAARFRRHGDFCGLPNF